MIEIAKITIKEFIRLKVLYIGIIVWIIFLFLSYLLSQLTLNQGNKVIVDFNLSVIEIFALILTLFLWAWILYNEFTKKTILIILSRLKNKYEFILGKFLGFSFILFVIYFILFIWFLLSLYFHGLEFKIYYLQALFLSYLKILVVLSMVLFFSTFVWPFLALLTTLVLYIVSHASSFMYFYTNNDPSNQFWPIMKISSKIIYYVLPNFQDLSMKEYFLSPYLSNYSNVHFVLSIIWWSLVYVFIFLLFASLIFNKKEF